MFYTSVWVGEIYTNEQISNGRDPNDPELQGEANRAGSRALLFNAVVNLSSSVVFPFLVSSSGIQGSQPRKPVLRNENSNSMGGMSRRSETRLGRMLDNISDKMDTYGIWDKFPTKMKMKLPIEGFTLIRAWIIGQAVFALTMFAT